MLFPSTICLQYDIAKTVWVRYVQSDKACESQPTRRLGRPGLTFTDFHCMLAIAASFINSFCEKPRSSSASLGHLSQAYTLINAKLSGPNAISDSSIAVVTALTIYQRIHQQQSTGMIHFDGLVRMIQLRGGIAKLAQHDRALALKPYR